MQENACCFNGKRTVENNRNILVKLAGLPQIVEVIQQCLRAADGKGWDDEVAAAIHRIIDQFNKGSLLIIHLMQPIAIRRFDEQEIRTIDYRWILDDRLIRLAEVAGKDELRFFTAFPNPHFKNSRT